MISSGGHNVVTMYQQPVSLYIAVLFPATWYMVAIATAGDSSEADPFLQCSKDAAGYPSAKRDIASWLAIISNAK